jgi:hypothetical protein
VVECAPKLAKLFQRSFPAVQIVSVGDPPDARTLSDADLQVAAASACRWLRPAVEDFPRGPGYLRADPARVTYWRQRLGGPGSGLIVGFAWRSSNLQGTRAQTCAGIEQWGPILGVPGVRFVCLQYDECRTELEQARARFGVELHAVPDVDLFNDLEEAAALTQAMELVISAPTAVSTLAGALGVETWRMSYGSDWKMLGTGRDPWYTTLQCFDRAPGQPWEEIVGRVSAALAARVSMA